MSLILINSLLVWLSVRHAWCRKVKGCMSSWLLCFFSIQIEELRSRLTEAEKHDAPGTHTPAKRNSLLSNGVNGSPPALPEEPLQPPEVQKAENKGTHMRDSVPANGVIVCF